jgi:hypothetical protein
MDYAVSKGGKAAYSIPLAASGYVSEVDALRCIAMTAVVLQHCQLLPFGWTGVWLFFVISGFAITSSLLGSDRIKHSRPLLVRNFYARRCLSHLACLFFGCWRQFGCRSAHGAQ